MALKDTHIKNAKPSTKPFKLTDGEGLHLEVRPNGAKLWRLRYRLHGKESVYSIGKYPVVSLALARERRTEAKQLIEQGINPSLHRKQEKVRQAHESRNTFKAIAEEWLERNADVWTEKTYLQRERLLLNDVYPFIGNLPIRKIVPAQILEIIQRVERRAPSMAIIAQQAIGAIFRLAIITLRADSDPTQPMRGVIKPRKVAHHKILKQEELPAFLKAVDEYSGYFVNQLALRLAILTLARSNDVLQSTWNEFDLEKAIWAKPAHRVKKREEHSVPLPRQAVELLQQLQSLTGHREHLFPNRNNPRKPASKGVLWKAFVSMGYKDKFTPHGLRGTGSTILNEMGFRSDVIEKQLDHQERDKTRASYNRADYFDERRQMMQAWADYLDQIKEVDNIVAIFQGAS
jgi:integrase